MAPPVTIGRVAEDYKAAALDVDFVSAAGDLFSVSALVDTGLSEDAAVDSEAVTKLGLTAVGSALAEMADGSVVPTRTYDVSVRVGEVIEKRVIAVEAEVCMVGLPFFRGRRLSIDVQGGGDVSVINLNELG